MNMTTDKQNASNLKNKEKKKQERNSSATLGTNVETSCHVIGFPGKK